MSGHPEGRKYPEELRDHTADDINECLAPRPATIRKEKDISEKKRTQRT